MENGERSSAGREPVFGSSEMGASTSRLPRISKTQNSGGIVANGGGTVKAKPGRLRNLNIHNGKLTILLLASEHLIATE